MFQLDFTSILQEKTFLCTHDFKQFRHVTQKSSFFRSLLRGGKGRGGWGVIIYQGWRRMDDPPIPSDNVTTPPLGHHMIRYIRYVPKEKKNMAAVLQSLRSRSYAVGQLICQPNSVRRYEIFNLFVTTNVCATCLAHAPNGGINVQVFFQLDGCSRFWCESCRTWIGGILSPEHFGERRTGPRVCQNRYKSLNVVRDYFTGLFCRFCVFLETYCNSRESYSIVTTK